MRSFCTSLVVALAWAGVAHAQPAASQPGTVADDPAAHKPDECEAVYQLGVTLEGMARFCEAREQYAAYLDAMPDGRFAKQARAGLERVQKSPNWKGDCRSDGLVPGNFSLQSLHVNGLEGITAGERSALEYGFTRHAFNNAGELTEHIRDFLMQRGFFKATVQEAVLEVLDASRWPAPVAVRVNAEPGARYTLDTITFSASAFPAAQLRPLFDIRDGEFFDVAKIREGMSAVRALYNENGYVNALPIPATRIDDQRGSISLLIEVSEGAK